MKTQLEEDNSSITKANNSSRAGRLDRRGLRDQSEQTDIQVAKYFLAEDGF